MSQGTSVVPCREVGVGRPCGHKPVIAAPFGGNYHRGFWASNELSSVRAATTNLCSHFFEPSNQSQTTKSHSTAVTVIAGPPELRRTVSPGLKGMFDIQNLPSHGGNDNVRRHSGRSIAVRQAHIIVSARSHRPNAQIALHHPPTASARHRSNMPRDMLRRSGCVGGHGRDRRGIRFPSDRAPPPRR